MALYIFSTKTETSKTRAHDLHDYIMAISKEKKPTKNPIPKEYVYSETNK